MPDAYTGEGDPAAEEKVSLFSVVRTLFSVVRTLFSVVRTLFSFVRSVLKSEFVSTSETDNGVRISNGAKLRF